MLIVNKNKVSVLSIVTIVLILASIFWTTFIIIAWQSGL
ncbi:hypothetical protein EH5_02791 [Bacillus subtilis]|nr:hypothetical protein EH5_02791 [Bacillus subtilis]